MAAEGAVWYTIMAYAWQRGRRKFESDIDMSLSNSSIGADAPAATFGKTTFADFASVRYKHEEKRCGTGGRCGSASCRGLCGSLAGRTSFCHPQISDFLSEDPEEDDDGVPHGSAQSDVWETE